MVLSSFFINPQMINDLLAFFECISFEIVIVSSAYCVDVRMRCESAINQVIKDVSALFEIHSESFGYQESEFILFDDELIANVIIGNFFGTQIPVMISIEIVLERLKIFLDRNYIVQKYIENFDFAII